MNFTSLIKKKTKKKNKKNKQNKTKQQKKKTNLEYMVEKKSPLYRDEINFFTWFMWRKIIF